MFADEVNQRRLVAVEHEQESGPLAGGERRHEHFVVPPDRRIERAKVVQRLVPLGISEPLQRQLLEALPEFGRRELGPDVVADEQGLDRLALEVDGQPKGALVGPHRVDELLNLRIERGELVRRAVEFLVEVRWGVFQLLGQPVVERRSRGIVAHVSPHSRVSHQATGDPNRYRRPEPAGG